MKAPSVAHGSFVLERTYDASPARVFSAWAEPDLKAQWFVGPETWSLIKRELDFLVGGRELLHGRFIDGMETSFTAHYHDIIANSRIVYVYDIHLNKRLHSVSLATVEITPASSGSRLVFTEQIAFLDGTNSAEGTSSREGGTAAHLNRLGQQLR